MKIWLASRWVKLEPRDNEMKIAKTVVALTILAFAGAASAQDCGNAIPLHSHETLTSDTCPWGGGSIAGYSFDHMAVYSFVAENADAIVELTGNPDLGIVLSNECKVDPSIVDWSITSVDSSLINDGETGYIYVVPSDGMDTTFCGEFSLDVGAVLPVELQKFSIH